MVIEVPDQGVLIIKRKIEPYNNRWALPGLRIMKPESIHDTIERIALQEAGLTLDLTSLRYLGQYVGRFQTEHNRQDLSTGYAVKANSSVLSINPEHFFSYRLIYSANDIPKDTGGMYKFYLNKYFEETEI